MRFLVMVSLVGAAVGFQTGPGMPVAQHGSRSVPMLRMTAPARLDALGAATGRCSPAQRSPMHRGRARAQFEASAPLSAISLPSDGAEENGVVATPSSSGTTIAGTVANIFNNVAGAGILTLAYGMRGVGWVPAMVTCVTVGAISGWTFYLVGTACQVHHSSCNAMQCNVMQCPHLSR